MKRDIIPTKVFENLLNDLVKKNKALIEDYEALKKLLAANPKKGSIISGTSGLRKIRLKSTSKGKSGGFRVCYYDDPLKEEIYLIWLFPKNEQENLSASEKKDLKALVKLIKRK